jgi:hypothetical protein
VPVAESAAPPPAAVGKPKPAATATRPAPKAPAKVTAAAAAPKAKKSSAWVFWLVGSVCLGLVLIGAAVVALLIAASALKPPEDKLLGQWVLDKEATKQYNPIVLRAYQVIRYEFKKGGACTVQLNQETTERTWGFLKESNGQLVVNLSVPGENTPTALWIEFRDDDHIEVSYPLQCRLRRAGPGDASGGPAGPGDGRDDKAPRLLASHKKMITGLAFSADGARLASSSLDETALVWDPASATAKQTLRGQPGAVRGVAFLPDGKTVITAGGSGAKNVGTVKSWDPDTGQMKAVLREQKNVVFVLAMSPDGKFLAWDDGTWVILWDVAGAKVRATLEDLGGTVRGLAFSRDGKKLAGCGSSDTVRIWDVEQPAGPSVTTRVKEALCLASSPDGVLAVGSESQAVTLWNPAAKKGRRVIPGFPGDVRAVAYSPDGKVLAASSRDAIRCFDPADGRELASWKSTTAGNPQLGWLAFSPDGKKLASGAAEADSGSIFLWDVDAMLKPTP